MDRVGVRGRARAEPGGAVCGGGGGRPQLPRSFLAGGRTRAEAPGTAGSAGWTPGARRDREGPGRPLGRGGRRRGCGGGDRGAAGREVRRVAGGVSSPPRGLRLAARRLFVTTGPRVSPERVRGGRYPGASGMVRPTVPSEERPVRARPGCDRLNRGRSFPWSPGATLGPPPAAAPQRVSERKRRSAACGVLWTERR